MTADEISGTGSIEPGARIRASLTGYRPQIGFEPSVQTPFIDYFTDGDQRVARVWLTDAGALAQRLAKTKPYAIGGVAFADLLSAGRRSALLPAILAFKAGADASSPPSQFHARWSIEGAEGVMDQVDSDVEAALELTLEAPDGNYAVNWSLIGADGAESGRGGAVLPLYRPTLTPTPTRLPRRDQRRRRAQSQSPRPSAAAPASATHPRRPAASPSKSAGTSPAPPARAPSTPCAPPA